MIPSLSFDPIAHLYDATRGYPDDVARMIAREIAKAAQATPQTSFLEVGIGTGRIAFPLASLGHTYTGIDISQRMLAELEKKLRLHAWREDTHAWGTSSDEDTAFTPQAQCFSRGRKNASLRLVAADMTQVPFHAVTFDVVVAVHVFHLIPDWQKALQEVVRVLRPGVVLLHCWDEHNGNDLQLIRKQWSTFLQELGEDTQRPGASSTQMVSKWLCEQGFQSEQFSPIFWKMAVTPRVAIENFTRRYWSGTWSIPDDIFASACERLWQWANIYYGTRLDTPRVQERRFIINKIKV